MTQFFLPEDQFFGPDPRQKGVALELYSLVKDLPLICPHGHVDPHLFSDPDATFGTPAELFIIPDHYVTRMLYQQGIPLHQLGIPEAHPTGLYTDQPSHRKIWGIFCRHYHLFRGTPSGIWLAHVLSQVFSIWEKPGPENADRLYDQLAEKLASPEFAPRRTSRVSSVMKSPSSTGTIAPPTLSP